LWDSFQIHYIVWFVCPRCGAPAFNQREGAGRVLRCSGCGATGFTDAEVGNATKKLTFKRYPDPSTWHRCINKIFSKLGDITTAGRRFNWVLMPLYEKDGLGFMMHNIFQGLITTGHYHPAQVVNRTTKSNKISLS
jgi:hypothetical protein